MPSITTFLTFHTQAEEAARFYTSVFPNSKVSRVTHFPDVGPLPGGAPPPFKAGSVMTVEFTLDGRPFIALNGGEHFEAFTQSFSVCVLCDTQQQMEEYWNKFLAAGGVPSACGWLTDHFGVSWQIQPRLLMELVTDPDAAKAAKAMRAMMTMVKIDSDALRRAVAT